MTSVDELQWIGNNILGSRSGKSQVVRRAMHGMDAAAYGCRLPASHTEVVKTQEGVAPSPYNRAMILVGTSGYNYPEWKGSFYPEGMPPSAMLPYYAARFRTVEINYSFYRLPNEKTIADWVDATPSEFVFTLKAPQRITHQSRLKDCVELVGVFTQRATLLGPKQGVLLFQLPPSLRKNLDVLTAFLGWLPQETRAAMEFRHASWLSDDVYDLMRARNVALCVTDSETTDTPIVTTADFGYFRLRDEGYDDDDLARWAGIVSEHAAAWQDTFVYFKHEEAGKGPLFAKGLLAHLAHHDA